MDTFKKILINLVFFPAAIIYTALFGILSNWLFKMAFLDLLSIIIAIFIGSAIFIFFYWLNAFVGKWCASLCSNRWIAVAFIAVSYIFIPSLVSVLINFTMPNYKGFVLVLFYIHGAITFFAPLIFAFSEHKFCLDEGFTFFD